MIPIPDVINGQETVADPSSPLAALGAFYKGFNDRSLEAMEANWAKADVPSMNNPIGGIRRGWSEISEGYRRLFSGPARVYVEFHEISEIAGADFHQFVGRERGYCETEAGRLDLKIRTSRLFVRDSGMWRHAHHHGSIESPELLRNYQIAILGKEIT